MMENYTCLKTNGIDCYRDIDIKKAEATAETVFNDLDG